MVSLENLQKGLTDFDGIDGRFDIGSPDEIPLLFQALEKSGFTPNQIEKIAYKNAERVISEIL